MDAPLSFSADADNKGWLKDKALPALKNALPVVQKVSQIGAVIFPNSAVIGKIAQVSVMRAVISRNSKLRTQLSNCLCVLQCSFLVDLRSAAAVSLPSYSHSPHQHRTS